MIAASSSQPWSDSAAAPLPSVAASLPSPPSIVASPISSSPPSSMAERLRRPATSSASSTVIVPAPVSSIIIADVADAAAAPSKSDPTTPRRGTPRRKSSTPAAVSNVMIDQPASSSSSSSSSMSDVTAASPSIVASKPKRSRSVATPAAATPTTTASGGVRKRKKSTVEIKYEGGSDVKRELTMNDFVSAAPSSSSSSMSTPTKSSSSASTPSKTKSPRSSISAAAAKKVWSAPADWRTVYLGIENMRRPGGIAANAPVDTVGCERLATHTEGKHYRFQTLVSLMLSSQTKDVTTGAAMANLHAHFESEGEGLTAQNLVKVDPITLDKLICKVGFHQTKTINIQKAAAVCIAKYDGDIPDTIEGLMALNGVGPKMGYLTLQCAWKRSEGIGVDTHVHRISNRLGWIDTKTAEETRLALQQWLPLELWGAVNYLMVGFGQTVCKPIGPRCVECKVNSLCPEGRRNARGKLMPKPEPVTEQQSKSMIKGATVKDEYATKFAAARSASSAPSSAASTSSPVKVESKYFASRVEAPSLAQQWNGNPFLASSHLDPASASHLMATVESIADGVKLEKAADEGMEVAAAVAEPSSSSSSSSVAPAAALSMLVPSSSSSSSSMDVDASMPHLDAPIKRESPSIYRPLIDVAPSSSSSSSSSSIVPSSSSSSSSTMDDYQPMMIDNDDVRVKDEAPIITNDDDDDGLRSKKQKIDQDEVKDHQTA